ncbi:MAG: hypothetical protein NDI67_06835 [Sulfuritalea sp.]|nr:hypothetical protein [Sulfuritalea sp.]
MKNLLAVMLFCALSPAALAQGGMFTDILRSVTGAVGRSDAQPEKPQTAVLGVRGMDEGDAKTAAPAGEAVKMLESWAVGRREAEAAAGRRGLTARAVNYESVGTDNTNSQGAQ